MQNNIIVKLAHLTSLIFHPSVIILYFLVILFFGDTYFNGGASNFRLRVMLIIYIGLITSVLPLFLIQIVNYSEKFFNFKFLGNYNRHANLLIFAICYIVSMLITIPFLGVYFTQKLFLTIAIVVSIANVITTYKPISLHMLSIAIATTTIWTVNFSGYGDLISAGLNSVFIGGIIGSSRLILGKSTISEIGYSYFFGVLSTLILLYL